MEVKSDIEIAQACAIKPIRDIAAVAGVDEEYLEYYGKYKAKIDLKLLDDRADRPDGKLILVTAINPTPAGEGKTTTTVGLRRSGISRDDHKLIRTNRRSQKNQAKHQPGDFREFITIFPYRKTLKHNPKNSPESCLLDPDF